MLWQDVYHATEAASTARAPAARQEPAGEQKWLHLPGIVGQGTTIGQLEGGSVLILASRSRKRNRERSLSRNAIAASPR